MMKKKNHPVNHEQLKNIEEIFQVAIDLPESERIAYIAKVCGENEILRKYIERLIAPAVSNINEFLRTAVYTQAKQEAQVTAKLPIHIGHYTIVRKVGEGGMGVVYEAKQESPYRTVALKVIRSSLQSKMVLQRFKQEAEIQGRLQHPGIAHIYEAGISSLDELSNDDEQYPFYAMEFIRGQLLTAYAKSENLNTKQRLELMTLVCDAAHYAHMQGIIHRDLKPANILVNSSGQPKILDFGVACIMDKEAQSHTLQTGDGQLMGTLPYMSPEQVVNKTKLIDASSDVYALGVILFELLAGQLPHDVSDYSIPEAARVIQEKEPRHLSSVNPEFRGDINTVVCKALEKSKARRYQSAADLASDIRRYLNNEPIVARPTSTLYQLKKFTIRNKALVGSILVVTFISIVGAILMGMFAMSEAKARRMAELKTLEAQRLTYRASVAAAFSSLGQYDCASTRRHLEQAPESQRGWEWHHIYNRLDESLYAYELKQSVIKNLMFSNDGDTIFTLSVMPDSSRPSANFIGYSKVRIASFSVPQLIPITERFIDNVSAIHFCKKGTRLRYVGLDHHSYEEDIITGENHTDHGMNSITKYLPDGRAIAELPDGSTLIEYSDRQLAILELNSNIPRKILGENKKYGTALAVDSTGEKIAYIVGGLNRTKILVQDILNGDILHVFSGHKESVLTMAFSPDNNSLITGSADHTIRKWNLSDGKKNLSQTIEGHIDRVSCIAFNPAGDIFASGSQDRTVRLWDAATGKSLAVNIGHTSEIAKIAFSPDGKYIVSCSKTASIRLWDATRVNDPRVLRGHELYVYPVALSPNNNRIASGSWDGTVRFWDAASSEWIATLDHPDEGRKIINWLAYNPEGTMIAAIETPLHGTKLSQIRIIDVDTGNNEIKIKPNERWTRTAFNPDGSILAATGLNSLFVSLIDTQTFEEIDHVPGQSFCVFSPSGSIMATAIDSDVLLYEVSTKKLKAKLTGHEQLVFYAAFNHNETQLATASIDDTIRIWDVITGQLITILRGHSDDVYALAYSPDDSRLATGSNDRTIRLWHTATWDEVAQFNTHQDHVYSLVYSTDGSHLISGSGDYTIRIWETQPLRQRIQSRKQRVELIEKVTPMVEALQIKYKDPQVVASHIRELSEIDSRTREIALQIVLSKSINH